MEWLKQGRICNCRSDHAALMKELALLATQKRYDEIPKVGGRCVDNDSEIAAVVAAATAVTNAAKAAANAASAAASPTAAKREGTAGVRADLLAKRGSALKGADPARGRLAFGVWVASSSYTRRKRDWFLCFNRLTPRLSDGAATAGALD